MCSSSFLLCSNAHTVDGINPTRVLLEISGGDLWRGSERCLEQCVVGLLEKFCGIYKTYKSL